MKKILIMYSEHNNYVNNINPTSNFATYLQDTQLNY